MDGWGLRDGGAGKYSLDGQIQGGGKDMDKEWSVVTTYQRLFFFFWIATSTLTGTSYSTNQGIY